MSVVSAMIDTHAYYQTLKDAGVSERQADAMTKGLAAVMIGTLATKADIGELRTEIADLRAELKTEIGELRTELKTEIAELRTELKGDNSGLRVEFERLRGQVGRIEAQLQMTQRGFGFLATYTTLIVAIATVVNHFVR
jgi:hypothetical protein